MIIIRSHNRCLFLLGLLALYTMLSAQSPLKSGTWFRIATTQRGVYKIDYNFLTQQLKVNPSDINLSNVGVFGYSGGALPEDNAAPYYSQLPENSIEIYDQNNNNKWDSEDYVLFYSAGIYRWQYQNSRFVHTSAYYTDQQVFFFTTTQGTRKTVSKFIESGSPSLFLNQVDLYGVYEKDSVNPNKTGRIWYDRPLMAGSSDIIATPNLPTVIAGSLCRVQIGYFNKVSSGLLTIIANDRVIYSKSLTASPDYQIDTFQFINPSDNINLKVNVTASDFEKFYLDYIAINALSNLKVGSQPLHFRTSRNLGVNGIIEFQIDPDGKEIQVWNVTDITNIRSILETNNRFKINNQSLQELVAFSPNHTLTPSALGTITNQDLLSLNPAYHTIITHSQWIKQANELAEFHKQQRGIDVNVIDIAQCYNDFSSGNKDPMAIRRMMRHFYKKGKPKTLLLFGDASIAQKSAEDYIPTYETLVSEGYDLSYCTDDFYGLLDSTESTLMSSADLDIGIGRLPVNSVAEANIVLNKIKAYKSAQSYGDWRLITSLVADDVDNPVDWDFMLQSELLYSKLNDSGKTHFEKIYLDAFKQEVFSGGQRYEEADKMIRDRMIFGSLLITYIGHGSSSNWAQERVLSLKDIETYKNIHNLPFVTTATCGFAPYDLPNNEKSAGEKFLIQRDGGAIAMMTTSREVYIQDQERYMNIFIEEFFKKSAHTGQARDFGEITQSTKNKNNLSINSQKINLLGDPALQLNLPQFQVKTTSISNGTSDTLKSLSLVTISAQIVNGNGAKISNFNGWSDITIYDKPSLATTNNNDNQRPKKDSFLIQNNIIFKGRASVKNGELKVQFVVPKNINYAIGRGRILYYAADTTNKPYRDAASIDTNVYIGGANQNASSDNKPPTLMLYMNDTNFGFGGITHANPKLIVRLYDDNGINTSNSGIGHDIEAILDDNAQNPIILNRYYRTMLDDYQRGEIVYPFYNLKSGRHTLKVRAWDVFNQPGEGYTEFLVYADEALVINRLLNFPNPFTTNTYFEFEHNRPGEQLDVTINVMTVTGQVVKSIHTKIATEGFRASRLIQWNGLDNYGDKIGRGVYIYNVTIRDSKGNTASKFEKMVLLQ